MLISDYLYLIAVAVLIVDVLVITLMAPFLFILYKKPRIIQRFIDYAFDWIMKKICNKEEAISISELIRNAIQMSIDDWIVLESPQKHTKALLPTDKTGDA